MAAPPNYNPTPLTPSAGGTIHPMSGGGDGGAPPHYDPNPLTTYVNPSLTPIKAYTGGGPNNIQRIAVGAIATHEATTAANTVNATTTAANTVNATTTATTTAATVPAATVPATAATAATSTNTTEASEKKQISLGGLILSISPPFDLKQRSQQEALKWFGIDKATDHVELQKEVIKALYDGVCDTDKPLIMVLECEPIRRLVQSLAEKLLGNLTRPVVKKTPAEITAVVAAIAAEERKLATLMTFNVFKNQCQKKTAKEYIESSGVDIVCTQQDNKVDLVNYKEVKGCGNDESAARIYVKNGIPFTVNSECITIGDKHCAVLFTYQRITIVNMGSSDQELLKRVLEKKPHIILGNVDGIVLPHEEWARADPINKNLNTADAIWYKIEPELFELNKAIIGDIKVKNDDYTKPELCSYSDHNPITAEIHFKKTINQLATNADQAAVAAAKEATETSQKGSRIVNALGITSNGTTLDVIEPASDKTIKAAQITSVETAATGATVETAATGATVETAATGATVETAATGTTGTDTSPLALSHSPETAEHQLPPSSSSSLPSSSLSTLAQTDGIAQQPLTTQLPSNSTASSPETALTTSDVTAVTEPISEQVPELTLEVAPGSVVSTPAEKVGVAAAATVAAISTPSATVHVLDDELAKKIAVAAVAVMLYHDNINQGSVVNMSVVSEIAAPSEIAEQSHMNKLVESFPELNNNQIASNNINEHVEPVVFHNQHPNGSEFESSPTVQPATPSSVKALNNSSSVVFHNEKNNNKNQNSSTVELNSSPPSPIASQPNSSSSAVESQPSYKNELDSLLANNMDPTSFKTYKRNGPITPVLPTNPPPKPVKNGNNRLLNGTKEKTTTAVKERTGNQPINLTENFKKRNALTAELKQNAEKKQKTIRGLNRQLKNEGRNLSQSLKPSVEPEPVVEPVSTNKAKKQPTANELNANLFKSIQQRPSKKTPLTPHQLLQNELETLNGLFDNIVPQAKHYITQMWDAKSPYARKTEDKLTKYIATLESYRPELNRFRGYNNVTSRSDEINAFIEKCMKPINKIKEIIYSPIFGGKRRTQKKRKQTKQKKRFGTQKK